MTCEFQLDAYQIESVSVATNAKFDAARPAHTGDVSCEVGIAPHRKDATKYRLTLDVQVKPNPKKERDFFAYHVAIKGRAFFTFSAEVPRVDAEHTLRLNGASILYGLLRAQVAQITAQGEHGQFLLPPMNFVELEKGATSPPPKSRKASSPQTP